MPHFADGCLGTLTKFFNTNCYCVRTVSVIVRICDLLPFTETFVYCHVATMHMMDDFDLAQIKATVHPIKTQCLMTLCAAVVITVDVLYIDFFVGLQPCCSMIAVCSAMMPSCIHHY
jgi:hypothetical protein